MAGETVENAQWPKGTPYDCSEIHRTLRKITAPPSKTRYVCDYCNYSTCKIDHALKHCKVKQCRQYHSSKEILGSELTKAVQNLSQAEEFLQWIQQDLLQDPDLFDACAAYGQSHGLDETPQVLNNRACRIVEYLMKNGLLGDERRLVPRFLDIGSGCGRLAYALQRLPINYTGVELSSRRVTAARSVLSAPNANRHPLFRYKFLRQNFLSVKIAKLLGFHFVGFNVFWPKALEMLAKSMCVLTKTSGCGFGGCILLLLPQSFWETGVTRSRAHVQLQEMLHVHLFGTVPIVPVVRYIRDNKRFRRGRMLPDSIFFYVSDYAGEEFKELVRGIVCPVKQIALLPEEYGEELDIPL